MIEQKASTELSKWTWSFEKALYSTEAPLDGYQGWTSSLHFCKGNNDLKNISNYKGTVFSKSILECVVIADI